MKYTIYLNFIQRFLFALARHTILSFVTVFMLSVFLGVVVFYGQEARLLRRDLSQNAYDVYLNEPLYQNVKEIWEEREERLPAHGEEKYPNPFTASSPSIDQKGVLR